MRHELRLACSLVVLTLAAQAVLAVPARRGHEPMTAAPRRAQLPAPPDVAAPPADADRLPSGLASKRLAVGSGATRPGPGDVASVHYTAWTTDGRMFEDTASRGEPVDMPIGDLVRGWSDGLALMVVGERRRFWMPESIARGEGSSLPEGMLVYDVELVGIKPGRQVPPTPSDVDRAPTSAEPLPSGLARKLLVIGSGTVHPTATSVVAAEYTIWTPDGTMIDSSYSRKSPLPLQLDRTIPGLAEAIMLMVEGESSRFWIPGELAYGSGVGGRPAGMLVCDVELLRIQ